MDAGYPPEKHPLPRTLPLPEVDVTVRRKAIRTAVRRDPTLMATARALVKVAGMSKPVAGVSVSEIAAIALEEAQA